MKGALSLRAYVDRSDRMLVLLDESYFTRLWCVFELAAFVKTCGGLHRTDFVVLHVPMLVFSFWFYCRIFRLELFFCIINYIWFARFNYTVLDEAKISNKNADSLDISL